MPEAVTIYHNPRCSKSRQTLAILQERGVEADVILYLEQPPTVAELQQLVALLGISPRDLLRKGEAAYKELGLSDASLSDEAVLESMVQHPKLIERPIVVKGKHAILGRPPENVLELL